MLALPEAWVWDFWLVDDDQQYHLFFLYASRALHDPDARHHRASVGHAVSDDLRSGRRNANTVSSLVNSAQASPPSDWMVSRTMLSPRPVPSARVTVSCARKNR